jgi:WD40 repeat protein
MASNFDSSANIFFHILQVKFHPNEGDTLSTSSVDSLINVFDLSASSEDDALCQTLSSSSSVRTLRWLPEPRASPVLNGAAAGWTQLAAVTSNEDLELWDRCGVRPWKTFTREDVAAAIKRTSVDHAYVADVHPAGPGGEVLVIAGSKSRER